MGPYIILEMLQFIISSQAYHNRNTEIPLIIIFRKKSNSANQTRVGEKNKPIIETVESYIYIYIYTYINVVLTTTATESYVV